MGVLTPGKITRAGLTPAFQQAANGDTMANSPKAYLIVRTGVSACTPTALFADDIDTVQPTGRVLSECPANDVMIYGPFADFPYSDEGGLVTFNYSTVSNVEAAAFYPGDLKLDEAP